MPRAAVIGKDGRTSAIIASLKNSKRLIGNVEVLSAWKFAQFNSSRFEEVRLALERLQRNHETPDFVVCGPEEPLVAEEGIANWLEKEFGIPCIGPRKELAKIESSKSFARLLLTKHKIPGNPRFKVFSGLSGIESFLKELGEFVIKPDGLTGGKGVRVSGEHVESVGSALDYCREVFEAGHPAIVIEEKLEGEEFSLQSFSDGTTLVDMPAVQDHKRAYVGDIGPNTGGMGSYSCGDHSLPFLTRENLRQASAINKQVVHALFEETGERYKGVLYGGFIATKDGVRLIEFNARFGDPESLNVLSLLKTDFVDVCEAIIQETLDKLPIEFENLATVCKYIVPEGYPENPVKGGPIDLGRVPVSTALRTFLAAVDNGYDGLYHLSGSRALAFVGIGETITEAERIAEAAAAAVRGDVYYRKDVGTAALVAKRVAHLRQLRAQENGEDSYPLDDAPHEALAKLAS